MSPPCEVKITKLKTLSDTDMQTDKNFDFERFKEEAIQGLAEGKKFGGADGVFGPMIKHLLESMLEGELTNHLEESKASGVANRRNGKTKKTVRSLSSGHLEIESGRDRDGTFTPKILPKRQLILTSDLEEKVTAMYAKGMSTRDISGFIKEMYAMEISATEISHITDKVIPVVNEWRTRPLEAIYTFAFLDCIHYKVRENGTIQSRAIYNILGVNKEGKKDLIGVYLSENEGAKFWLSVLTDLKQRGVEDILIACVDGLKGFPEAIAAVFPRPRFSSASSIRSALACVTCQKRTNGPSPRISNRSIRRSMQIRATRCYLNSM